MATDEHGFRGSLRLRAIRGWFLGDKLDFQVNNETYFVGLAEDERQWLVFVSTPNGPRSVPVYVDEPAFDDSKLVIEDKDRRKIVN